MSARRLRFGMVGGGRGAFIGSIHRIAAAMDGRAELVAGAFSSEPERSRESGADLLLDPTRVYDRYEEMARVESARETDDRLDFVVIVTPNDRHFAPTKRFLEADFNVVLDKPATLNLSEALELREVVKRSGKVLALTHNYTGNAMVKQARAYVRSGALGPIRKVVAEYSQGWLSTCLEASGQKQAQWRTDPARSGAGGSLGDIGTHALNLLRHVTGLRISQLCADLTSFVPSRQLDDDANILLRFEGGAKGVLHISQIAAGEENNLSLRVYGTEGSIEWRQERPHELRVRHLSKPEEIWRAGNDYLAATAKAAARLPPGHPEGYLEAFANVYREAFRAIEAEVSGRPLPPDLDFPTIEDGIEGMAFIEAAVNSSKAGGIWKAIS